MDGTQMHVYRNRQNKPLILTFAVAAVGLTVPVAVAALGRGIAFGAFPLGLVLLMTWIGVRAAFLGLTTSPDGVKVLNPLRTHHVPWASIQSFEYHDPEIGLAGARVCLDGGRRLRVYGILGGQPRLSNEAKRLVGDLNAELASRRVV